MTLEVRSINPGSGLDLDGFDENNANKWVQSVYSKFDGVDFGGQAVSGPNVLFAQRTTTGVSSTFDCSGRSRIAFKIEFNSSSVTATFRIWFKDNNATPFWRPSVAFTPQNIGTAPSGVGTAQSGYSHGVGFSVDTEGAKSFALQLTSISSPGSDNVSVWFSGI